MHKEYLWILPYVLYFIFSFWWIYISSSNYWDSASGRQLWINKLNVIRGMAIECFMLSNFLIIRFSSLTNTSKLISISLMFSIFIYDIIWLSRDFRLDLEGIMIVSYFLLIAMVIPSLSIIIPNHRLFYCHQLK